MKIPRLALITALLITATLSGPVFAETPLHSDAAVPFMVADDRMRAPYGQEMPEEVSRYTRVAPGVGAGGMIFSGGMKALADKGFKTVVSLLTPSEGAGVHNGWAMDADITFHNLAVTAEGPDDSVLKQFRKIMADPDNYPVMVYCSGGSRTGALWTRYRIDMGVPAEVAYQEGRTIGLDPSLEKKLRKSLAARDNP